MANEILSKYAASTALTVTVASLADGSMRQATQITDTSPAAPRVRIHYRVTTGTSPTINKTIEFYVSRADDDGTELADGGSGTTDAAYTGDEEEVELVRTQIIDATSDKAYDGSFLIEEPGTDWRLIIKNNTGVALNSTAGNHIIRYRTIIPEVQ